MLAVVTQMRYDVTDHTHNTRNVPASLWRKNTAWQSTHSCGVNFESMFLFIAFHNLTWKIDLKKNILIILYCYQKSLVIEGVINTLWGKQMLPIFMEFL